MTTSYAYALANDGRLSQLKHDLAASANDLTLGFTWTPASQIASRTAAQNAYSWTAHYNEDLLASVNGLNQVTDFGAAITYGNRGNLGGASSAPGESGSRPRKPKLSPECTSDIPAQDEVQLFKDASYFRLNETNNPIEQFINNIINGMQAERFAGELLTSSGVLLSGRASFYSGASKDGPIAIFDFAGLGAAPPGTIKLTVYEAKFNGAQFSSAQRRAAGWVRGGMAIPTKAFAKRLNLPEASLKSPAPIVIIRVCPIIGE